MENYGYPADDSSPGMGTAALVLGICSMILLITGLSFIAGALGILFALLSRGSGRMKSLPKVGLMLSITGLAIETAIVGAGIYMLRSGVMDPYIKQIQELYEYYYGDSGDSLDYFGDSPMAVLVSCPSPDISRTEWELFEGDVL